MRSKANIRGHPIHPALIPFPFAFLYGGFIFDLAGHLTHHRSWWITGGYLDQVGIVAALVAAAPPDRAGANGREFEGSLREILPRVSPPRSVVYQV